MARTKFSRTGRQRGKITDSHILNLIVGRDFFGGGFGDDLDGMRAAWRDADVRDRTRAMSRQRYGPRERPWAEIAFDEMGVTDEAGVRESRARYRQQRKSVLPTLSVEEFQAKHGPRR